VDLKRILELTNSANKIVWADFIFTAKGYFRQERLSCGVARDMLHCKVIHEGVICVTSLGSGREGLSKRKRY